MELLRLNPGFKVMGLVFLSLSGGVKLSVEAGDKLVGWEWML